MLKNGSTMSCWQSHICHLEIEDDLPLMLKDHFTNLVQLNIWGFHTFLLNMKTWIKFWGENLTYQVVACSTHCCLVIEISTVWPILIPFSSFPSPFHQIINRASSLLLSKFRPPFSTAAALSKHLSLFYTQARTHTHSLTQELVDNHVRHL